MIFWCKTDDGWAVNLDGTDAAGRFGLPRIELHAGPKGWTCVCHRENGTSLRLPLGPAPTAAGARRVAVEAMLGLGTHFHAELLALLERPTT